MEFKYGLCENIRSNDVSFQNQKAYRSIKLF